MLFAIVASPRCAAQQDASRLLRGLAPSLAPIDRPLQAALPFAGSRRCRRRINGLASAKGHGASPQNSEIAAGAVEAQLRSRQSRQLPVRLSYPLALSEHFNCSYAIKVNLA